MKPLPLVSTTAVLLALSASAGATFLSGNVGLGPTAQTITFDELALGVNDPVTTQFAALGVSFATAFANPDSASYPNLSGNRIGNFQAGQTQGGTFTAAFAHALSEAAFSYVSAPATSTFDAFLGNTLVESDFASTSLTSTANFYGFSGITFDRITITVDSFDHAFLLDNLQTVGADVTAVPEPGSWALLAGGVACIGVLRRRAAPGKPGSAAS